MLAFAILLIAGSANTALAQQQYKQYRWDGDSTNSPPGDWFDGQNWDIGLAPDKNSVVIIDTILPNAAIISGGTASVHQLAVGWQAASEGSVLISGASSELVMTLRSVNGSRGVGKLTIEDGGRISWSGTNKVLYMAFDTDAVGILNIGAAEGVLPAAPGFLDENATVLLGAGQATIVFNHTDTTGSYEFATDVGSDQVGTQVIRHEAGLTSLSGNSLDFTGTTEINGGTLAVNGSLGGQVNVGPGGTLAGTGTLSGSLSINSGGTVAPGSSIGTLTVSDIVFNAGSIYQVEVDGTGSDLIDATGTVMIDGGSVTVSGTPVDGEEYTYLTAAGGLTVNSELVVNDTLFVDYGLRFDPNNYYLLATIIADFCDFAGTANQQAVGCDGLDSLPQTNDIVQSVMELTTEEAVQAAYDALSGEVHPSIKGALMQNGQALVAALNDRINARFGNPDAAVSTAAFGSLSSRADGNNGFWITGFGTWGDTDATVNTAQMDNNLGGAVFGVDRLFGETWRFGVLGAYSQSDVSQAARMSSGSANTWSAGLYGGAEAGASFLSFGAIHNWHAVDTARTVSFPNVTQSLSASYDAQSWQLFAEAGHRLPLDHLMLEPFAGVSFISLDTDGYAETGGSAALTAAADTQETTFTTLGVRSSLQLSDAVHARGMLGWRHAFGDADPTSTFTLAGSNPFTITGAPTAKDALVTDLGLEAQLSDNAFLGASYNGQYGDGTTTHGFNAGFRARF